MEERPFQYDIADEPSDTLMSEGTVDSVDHDIASSVPHAGRRAAPRLRLHLPARLTAVDTTHPCFLINISRNGARIAMENPLKEDDGGVLRCHTIERFGIVTRSEPGVNALTFDEPLDDKQVLSIRRHEEMMDKRERARLAAIVRNLIYAKYEAE